MPSFWHRLATHNAPFIAAALRKLAEEVEAIWPGAPALAFPPVFWKGGPQVGTITVKDTDSPFGGTVSFLDAKGQPTSPDDVPQWSSDDENVAAVEGSTDGLSASVTPGIPGAAVITVTTTDTDGTVVTSQGTVTVQPGEAVIGDVEFQPPTP